MAVFLISALLFGACWDSGDAPNYPPTWEEVGENDTLPDTEDTWGTFDTGTADDVNTDTLDIDFDTDESGGFYGWLLFGHDWSEWPPIILDYPGVPVEAVGEDLSGEPVFEVGYTDDEGIYHIPLPPGIYDLIVDVNVWGTEKGCVIKNPNEWVEQIVHVTNNDE